MVESLQIPDDESLQRSLSAYKSWITRYENQIKTFNERINQLIKRVRAIVDCSCVRSVAHERTLGRFNRYTKALELKTPGIDTERVEENLEPISGVMYNQKKRIKQCKNIEEIIEAEIMQKKTAIETTLQKKEETNRKLELIESAIQYKVNIPDDSDLYKETLLQILDKV